jgi:hypothetical protein
VIRKARLPRCTNRPQRAGTWIPSGSTSVVGYLTGFHRNSFGMARRSPQTIPQIDLPLIPSFRPPRMLASRLERISYGLMMRSLSRYPIAVPTCRRQLRAIWSMQATPRSLVRRGLQSGTRLHLSAKFAREHVVPVGRVAGIGGLVDLERTPSDRGMAEGRDSLLQTTISGIDLAPGPACSRLTMVAPTTPITLGAGGSFRSERSVLALREPPTTPTSARVDTSMDLSTYRREAVVW